MKSKFLKTSDSSLFRGKKMVKEDRKRILFLVLFAVIFIMFFTQIVYADDCICGRKDKCQECVSQLINNGEGGTIILNDDLIVYGAEDAVLKIANSPHPITIDCNGYTIKVRTDTLYLIHVKNSSKVTVRNCILDCANFGNTGFYAFYMREKYPYVYFIDRTEIKGCKDYGVLIDNGPNSYTAYPPFIGLNVTNSFIHDNGGMGILLNRPYYPIPGTMLNMSDSIVRKNYIGIFLDNDNYHNIKDSLIADNTNNDVRIRPSFVNCTGSYCVGSQCDRCVNSLSYRVSRELPGTSSTCVVDEECSRLSLGVMSNFVIPKIKFCPAIPDACNGKPEESSLLCSPNREGYYACGGCGGTQYIGCGGLGCDPGNGMVGQAKCNEPMPILGKVEITPHCPLTEEGEYFCLAKFLNHDANVSSNFTVNVTITSSDNSVLDVCRYTDSIKVKFTHLHRNGEEEVSSTREDGDCVMRYFPWNKGTDRKCELLCNFSTGWPFFTRSDIKDFNSYKGELLWKITEVRFYNGYFTIAKSKSDSNLVKEDRQIRFLADLPNTGCSILDAFVDTALCTGMLQSDGTKKCILGDKVKVSVKMNENCDAFSIKKVRFDLSEGSDSGQEIRLPITGYVVEDSCSMELSTDPTDPREKLFCSPEGLDINCSGLIYIHDVSPSCFNKKLNASYVEIYNITNSQLHLVRFLNGEIGQFGTIIIAKPACNILSAKITNTCPHNICDMGKEINLEITVEDKTKCQNVNKMEIIGGSGAQGGITGFSILGMAAGGGSGGCSITMENSGRITKSNQGSNGAVYTSKWTIIGPIPEGCNGKEVSANTAKLYNATSRTIPIGSLSGSGVTGSFFFSYRELNKPMQAIINTTPNLEGNLDPFSEIKLQQLSIGDIRHWNWSYKSVEPSSTWTLYARDTSQPPLNTQNVTIKFSKLGIKIGNYYINLTVWNETMWDSTKVRISLLSPGQGPLARISSPLDDEVLLSREVLFDGSLSEWPEYEDLFNMTWIFSNTKNKTVNASVSPKKIIYRYDKTLASPNPFTIKLNASGDHKYTMDIVNFYIGVCNEGTPTNPKWIFANECFSDKPKWCDPGLCNPITKKCTFTVNCTECSCPDGMTCNMALGTCDAAQSMQTCASQGSSSKKCEDNDPPGCYWDKEGNPSKCKSCYSYGQRTITSCSNYNNDQACNKDTCQLGLSGADALLLMGQRTLINGEEYEVTQTQCSWNSTACILNATRSPVQYAPPVPPNVQCTYSTIIGACGSCNAGIFQGKLINYTLVPETQENCGDSYESCARCGFTQERLPFFTPWQIIPFIFLIAVYYFFILKKKK